ncbi:MAG: SGNH/GDSL hydrolase family protein [Ktedonobacteraceae bacterium]
MVLCFVLLTLGGCSSSPDGQPGQRPIVVQQAPKARLTYVALGASDTFGIGADDPQSENWPTDLSQKLGSGVRLVNLGVPDISLHQALSVEAPVAIDAHPDLVTIWLAVNDLNNDVPLKSYASDLDLLLSRIQAADLHTRIAVANIPDLTLLPYFKTDDLQTLFTRIQNYNSTIASVVKRHHVVLVDLYRQWHELRDHPEYISNDGLHPSTLGYTRIAEIFYQTLQSAS